MFAKFPSRSFFCYLAREIFLPREGNHFCIFSVFCRKTEKYIEILLQSNTFPVSLASRAALSDASNTAYR